MSDFSSYRGRRVVVSGCFSGMGESAAERLLDLGAEVHGIDYKDCKLPLASFNKVDLRNPADIEAAAEKIGGRVHALFNCAGLPQTFPPMDVMKVNYLAARRLTECILPLMKDGGGIASIASTAGLGWMQRMPVLFELIGASSFEAGLKWCEEHVDQVREGYSFSKEALIVWTMMTSFQTIKRGVRVNCILPGPTQTPMMAEFEKATPAGLLAGALQPINRRSTPREQADPLVFLNSESASYINGVALQVDGGFLAGMMTGQLDPSFMMQAAAAAQ